MSTTIKSFDSALDFAPGKAARGGIWTSIFTGFAAIHEGIVLAGEYKELTNRGVACDVAARKVFEKIGRA